jgi:hypothetical protein
MTVDDVRSCEFAKDLTVYTYYVPWRDSVVSCSGRSTPETSHDALSVDPLFVLPSGFVQTHETVYLACNMMKKFEQSGHHVEDQ